ncbi:VWA domain-containing protein [Patulibacter sp.]|uniref:VWA domain-containing protein n=1 Tax=Patulibacter sp. TaxID=1912859 RepID=UPI0027192882|nr:VWA domain-containing protein [Patulibacter sp.]MDO9406794.1 VWA domain-containing protein [Patulibacter sp.]
MSFAAPWFLLALLLVPAAAAVYVWWERRRSRGAQPWASPALMPSVASTAPGWHRHVGPAVYALAAIALIVALARPEHEVEVQVEQASVMLVTDRSGSMRSTDLKPTRMDAVKGAASSFLDQVPQEIRVGALAFNNKTRLLASPTTDRDRVKRALNTLTGAGSTATGDALGAALAILRPQGLRGPQTPAAIVLLSDGKNVRGRDPVRLARRAGRLGVRIFTISLGTDQGTLTSRNADGTTKTELVPPDRAAMRQIADASGGTTSDAPTAEALQAVYEKLGSAVATEPGKDQLTSAPVGVALVLLVVGAGLALRLTGRIV